MPPLVERDAAAGVDVGENANQTLIERLDIFSFGEPNQCVTTERRAG